MKNKKGLSKWIWILMIVLVVAIGLWIYFYFSGDGSLIIDKFNSIPTPPALP